MKTGYEIAYLETIPKFRRAVAKELYADGTNQMEIARLIGVTQAAVSKYLSSGGDTDTFDPNDLKRFVSAVKRGNIADAERIRCSACMKVHRFGCVFMKR